MSTRPLLLLCALHSLAFAAFHLGFWRLFDWPRSLAGTTRANRAIHRRDPVGTHSNGAAATAAETTRAGGMATIRFGRLQG